MGRIDWNREGFRELRKDPALVAHLKTIAEDAKRDLDAELHGAQTNRGQREASGYRADVAVGRTRARGYVGTETARAMAHEQAHDSLLKWAFRNGGQSPKRKG
ncbi:hypothetical protein Srot_0070 [Segniliparus rotundus DSM 44985]|uniref:HK97 gp10 family phage protein n=1 Tax=Segniliparus rotundus (strain ATCC BAA-972 / CDC 1076 / CIP 108378 / DSM 44985 / JCM 13578) TaxID=640132 RepID=D6Z9N6_SEGRD|nr:hypothetical protein [Segniliparus rotundus]ADG96563.1 hypothetical protein Srot_0070 [Segniliparus rotundus DSM 44985]